MFDDVTFLESLPVASRQALAVFSDPHPPGAVERARWSGRSVVELARAWPPDRPGLAAELDRLVAGIQRLGQSTLHQPQIPNYLRYVIGPGVPDDPVAATAELAARAADAERLTQEAIDTCARLGAELLADGDSVVISDFSPSSSWAILDRAARDGKRLSVFVPACRTRRANGLRAAREARALGHETTITTDAGTGWVLSSRQIRAAFVGADAFLGDGTVLTTNGALAIVSIAVHLGIEAYGVYDLWKYLEAWSDGLDELNDRADPDGVPEATDAWVAEGFAYLNPLVDRIPGRLFTAAITDAGILAPADVGRAALARYGEHIARQS